MAKDTLHQWIERRHSESTSGGRIVACNASAASHPRKSVGAPVLAADTVVDE